MTARHWLTEQEREGNATRFANGFVLDSKANLRAVVGYVAEESNADGIGLVAVLEDDEER